jgi:hypothetical protein
MTKFCRYCNQRTIQEEHQFFCSIDCEKAYEELEIYRILNHSNQDVFYDYEPDKDVMSVLYPQSNLKDIFNDNHESLSSIYDQRSRTLIIGRRQSKRFWAKIISIGSGFFWGGALYNLVRYQSLTPPDQLFTASSMLLSVTGAVVVTFIWRAYEK